MSRSGLRSSVLMALTLGIAMFVLTSPAGPAQTTNAFVSGQFSMTPVPGTPASKPKPARATASPPTPAVGKARPRTSTKPTVTKPKVTKPKSGKPTSLADRTWDMVPLPALPPYTDAAIKNSARSTHTLKVCRDWDRTTCRRGSASGVLAPGEDSSSKFGWDDTDGYRLKDRWVKEHGCFGCVVTVTVR